MLQILIWAVCVLIFGIGYCGKYIEKLVAIQKGEKTSGVGNGFLLLMILLGGILIALSFLQGTVLSGILNR